MSELAKVDSPYLDYPAELPRPKTLPPIPRAARTLETPEVLLACVCEAYGVTLDDLSYGGKRTLLAEARLVAYWLLRTVGKLSWCEVGAALNRDHTSAMAGCRRVVRRRVADLKFLAFTDELAAAVAARIGAV